MNHLCSGGEEVRFASYIKPEFFLHPNSPQNDETFFRQFITGFVQIWEEQLNLNFNDPPDWKDIKTDQGPHISRLPDELLPAIGKFLIIGKDRFQNDVSALKSSSTRIHCYR